MCKALEVANGNTINVINRLLQEERSAQDSYRFLKWHKKWAEEVEIIQKKAKEIEGDEDKLKELVEINVDVEKLDFSLIQNSKLSTIELNLLMPLLKNLPND